MTQTHKVTRLVDSYGETCSTDFVYRSVPFSRDDTNKGYWGHYRTFYNLGGSRMSDSTRKGLLLQIDSYLDKKETL